MSLNNEKVKLKSEVKDYLDSIFIDKNGDVILEELKEEQKVHLNELLINLRKNGESTVIFCKTIINYDINTRLRKKKINIDNYILSNQEEILEIALKIDKSIDI